MQPPKPYSNVRACAKLPFLSHFQLEERQFMQICFHFDWQAPPLALLLEFCLLCWVQRVKICFPRGMYCDIQSWEMVQIMSQGNFQCRGYNSCVSISEHGESPQTQMPFSEWSLPACWLGINHKAVQSTLLWSKEIHVPRAQWVSVAHLFTVYIHASIVWFLIIVVLVQFNLLLSFSLSEGIMNYERWKTEHE
jgi:hypothetical protein